MLRATTLVLTASLVTGLATHSEAGVIFDNLVATTYVPSGGDTIKGAGLKGGAVRLFDMFVAEETENLASILIPLWYGARSSADGLFNLKVTDASYNVLESWTGLSATPYGDSIPVMTVLSVLHPQFHSGETYVLILSPASSTTDVVWEASEAANDSQRAYRVLGAPLVSTPEPGTLTLAGLGALGLVARTLRRRKR